MLPYVGSKVQKQPHQPYNSIQFFTQSHTSTNTAAAPPRSESSAAAKYRRRCKKNLSRIRTSDSSTLFSFYCFLHHTTAGCSSLCHPSTFFSRTPPHLPLPNSTLTTGQRTGQFPPFIPLCREHLPDRFVLDDTGFHLHRRRGDLRNRPARNRALAPCKWPTFVALFSPLFDLFSSLPPSFSCVLFRSTTRHDTVTRRPYADCSADPINLAGW